MILCFELKTDKMFAVGFSLICFFFFRVSGHQAPPHLSGGFLSCGILSLAEIRYADFRPKLLPFFFCLFSSQLFLC